MAKRHGTESAAAPGLQRAHPSVGLPSSAVPAAAQPLPAASTSSAGGKDARDGSAAEQQGKVPLRDLLHAEGIVLRSYAPGQQNGLVCPKCQGGTSKEKSFGLHVSEDGQSAQYQCFRASCGHKGHIPADIPRTRGGNQLLNLLSTFGVGMLVNGSLLQCCRAAHVYDQEQVFAKHHRPGGVLMSRAADGKARGKKDTPPVLPDPKLQPLGREILDFFAKRCISADTLQRCGVAQEVLFSPPLGRTATAIAFPYYRDRQIVNVKYRTLDKQFWQVKGAEKVLYGLEDVAGQSEIVVVEGEMDKLALAEAGIAYAVSVPDGAPMRAKEGDLPPRDADVKYSYLWNCRGMLTTVFQAQVGSLQLVAFVDAACLSMICAVGTLLKIPETHSPDVLNSVLCVAVAGELDGAARIVLATDNDAPGNALAEELARRLGRERCWRVRWPGGEPGEGSVHRKDANEVLIKDGPQALAALLEAAEPYPIRGLFRCVLSSLPGFLTRPHCATRMPACYVCCPNISAFKTS